MEPDELFTVKFDMKTAPEENISFTLRFKNGNNWHESDNLSVSFDRSKNLKAQGSGNSPILPVFSILFITLIIITGFFVLMRRRRARSGNEID
jgi:ATP-dependent Zn protease